MTDVKEVSISLIKRHNSKYFRHVADSQVILVFGSSVTAT